MYSPNNKRKSFPGFSTAGSAVVDANDGAEFDGGGFSTATKVMRREMKMNSSDIAMKENIRTSSEVVLTAMKATGEESTAIQEENSAAPVAKNSVASRTQPSLLEKLLTIQLKVRGMKYHEENNQSLDTITLEREPKNPNDANAICVKNGKGNTVGYIAKEQALILATPMDTGIIKLDDVRPQEQNDSSLIITAKVNLLNSAPDANEMKQFQSQILAKLYSFQNQLKPTVVKQSNDIINDAEVRKLSRSILTRDTDTAKTCPFDILQSQPLSWKNELDGTDSTWPPSQEILDSLGYGAVDDEQWWQENTGLKPPSMWNVAGALDLLPNIPISVDQKQRARHVLDGAVHGVTNVWSDKTLVEIRDLMHSPKFWVHRSADAFIKAYGGHYVLGQQEGKLKLIKGAPHTPLTQKVCRGHNVVYELIHSTKPPEPGFNTLIFGLNLRGSGFHYHQDTIGELKAKNGKYFHVIFVLGDRQILLISCSIIYHDKAALVSKQPVVTTVYYEKPEEDSGKELVLWKPIMNFKPKNADSLYMAARAVQTPHGMVHVQRAGLQKDALHGIFHTPIFVNDQPLPTSRERVGYRVAITARINATNADELLMPFLEKGAYCRVYGPDGDKTLQLKE